MSRKSAFCIATSRFQADQIVSQLKIAKFNADDICLLFPEPKNSPVVLFEKSTRAAEGAIAGAIAGGLVGAAAGCIASVSFLAIPGAGSFVNAGPILAALSGTTIGAILAGLIGGMIGLSILKHEIRRQEGGIRAGNILISVATENPGLAELVKGIFSKTGAHDICSTLEPSAKDCLVPDYSVRPNAVAFAIPATVTGTPPLTVRMP